MLFWVPAGSSQQQVVSSRIELSADEASLRLEFAGGETLALGFAGGNATLNGEPLGRYAPGGESDEAWRSLLESLDALLGERLARRLTEWSPDAGLPADELRLLRSIDEALEAALADPLPAALPEDAPQTPAEATGIGPAISILGRDAGFLQAWAIAVEDFGLGEGVVHIDTDRTIPEDASVDGSVIMVDGLLQVRGRVRGHVVVMNGTLALAEGSRIDGDIRTLDSEIADGGVVLGGERVDLRRRLQQREERLHDRIRDETLSQAQRNSRSSQRRVSAYFHRVRAAAEGVLGTVVAFAVLGALALLFSVLGGHRVWSVAGELSNNPMGSTLVGFAGSYAILPVFLLGIAALTVTVIGIPALLIWVPLFPVAVCLAFFAGFVGAAENIGRWVLGLGIGWLGRLDGDRPLVARLAGIATLLLPFAVGSIFIAVPVIDWVSGLLFAAGGIACLVAFVAGFGAVLVTRGGTVRTRWPGGFANEDATDTEDWSAGERTP